MLDPTLHRLLGLASTLAIVSLPSIAIAQAEKSNLGTFEDDRIKIVLQECQHKQPDLICQAVLTSKNGDRTVELNSETIKLVDFEGNEYYPSNIRIANRSNSQKIQTELVENASFRTSITFAKVPNNLNKFALIQIPLGSNLNAIAKFRNLSIAASNNSDRETTTPTTKPKPSPTPNVATKPASPKSICPENTKVMYRAATNTRSLHICGNKKPTHYVGTLKENGESTTIELLSYTKNAFIAETGPTRYTIYNNRFAISKSERVILQEKLEVLQPFKTATTETPTNKPKKNTTTTKPKSTTTNKDRR
jgi:hypothetical protein